MQSITDMDGFAQQYILLHMDYNVRFAGFFYSVVLISLLRHNEIRDISVNFLTKRCEKGCGKFVISFSAETLGVFFKV